MSGMLLSRRWWGGVLLACFAAVVAALAMPVHLPQRSERTDSSSILPEDVAESAPEDLGAFLANRRWGVSLQDLHEAAAEKARPVEQTEPSINPALAKMGFVGLIVTKDQSAVLLESPEGGVARFAPGDTLPDGRILVSVTDNSLTLKGDDLPEEVLELFPRFRTEPLAGGSGDDGGDTQPAQ